MSERNAGNEIAAFLNEGDIFTWRWADPDKDNCAPFGDYHCYSRKAVVRNGKMRDTFWGDNDDSRAIPIKQCNFTYQGNINDMQVIPEYQVPYYDQKDIVDMRHSNNSRAPIYLRKNAKKCPVAMEQHVQHLIDTAKVDLEYTRQRLERQEENLRLILTGQIDEVFF